MNKVHENHPPVPTLVKNPDALKKHFEPDRVALVISEFLVIK